MPGSCDRSTFTGTHVFEVYKATEREAGKEKTFEAVRCGFCHAPAPAGEAARVLERLELDRRYRKARGNKKTDSQRAKEDKDAKARAAAQKAMKAGSKEFV